MTFSNYLDSIVESIIDPSRTGLDPKIFDGTEMRSGALRFFQDLSRKVNDVIDVQRAIIKGSILSYQWIDNTDIDILYEVGDKLKEEYIDAKFEEIQKLLGDLKYPGTNHPIQIFLHPGKYNEENADGIFDLDRGWIKGPYSIKVDIKKYLDEFKEIVNDLDLTTGELKRNITDYKVLKDLPSDEMSKFRSEIENTIFDINQNVDDLLDSREDIRSSRKEAFSGKMTPQEIKEYGSKNALPENVIFKLLERYHYLKFLDQLDDLADDGLDKKDIENIKFSV